MDTAIQSLGSVAVQQGLMANGFKSRSKDIDKTAQDFVAMFMAQMIQPMFEGVEVNTMFGGGHGEEVMRSLLIQEYGKAMAQNDTSGLSDSIKAEMIRMQEKNGNKASIISKGAQS